MAEMDTRWDGYEVIRQCPSCKSASISQTYLTEPDIAWVGLPALLAGLFAGQRVYEIGGALFRMAAIAVWFGVTITLLIAGGKLRDWWHARRVAKFEPKWCCDMCELEGRYEHCHRPFAPARRTKGPTSSEAGPCLDDGGT